MTKLENRPNSGLLVVDVQTCVVEAAHQRDSVVSNIGALADRARRQAVPVVWIQHSDDEIVKGSDDWQIVPELTPGETEPLAHKNYGDSFEATTQWGATPPDQVIAHTNLYWAYQTAPGRTAGTVETKDVDFSRT